MNFELEGIDLREGELLSKHSSFKTGGPAKCAIFPKNTDELSKALTYAIESGEKYRIVGNCSNILFDDKGFDGILIFTKGISDTIYIRKKNSILIKAECGKSLTELASEAGKKHALCGLEFAYGIPGSIGGAVYMNAGAYGGQMSDVVIESEYFDTTDRKVKVLSKDDHDFGYRHSAFEDNTNYVILSTLIELKEGDPEAILALMTKNMSARKEKQPLEYPNAGSTFKRPEGYFAGKLIEDCGLKGYTVGGAQVSEKHAGFVINRGGATSEDILKLIEHIKNTVLEKFGVSLETEIIHIPF